MNGISIIIPIFNEATNIPALLESILSQTLKPDEVIFVDSGSTDNTKQILAEYFNSPIVMRHIENLGGMPGGNRNKGLLESKYDWIAFIDAGIIPSHLWLEELMGVAKNNHAKAVFGKCVFSGTTAFSNAICGVSYGCTTHPVIPASIFHRDIFKKTGFFIEHLRAGEDTLWLRSFDEIYKSRVSTFNIVASYNSFPINLSALVRKYYAYENSLISAKLGILKGTLLALFLMIMTIATVLDGYISILLLFSYLLARGILDPIRRSNSVIWWRDFPISAFLAPICVLTIDLTIAYTRIVRAVIKTK